MKSMKIKKPWIRQDMEGRVQDAWAQEPERKQKPDIGQPIRDPGEYNFFNWHRQSYPEPERKRDDMHDFFLALLSTIVGLGLLALLLLWFLLVLR